MDIRFPKQSKRILVAAVLSVFIAVPAASALDLSFLTQVLTAVEQSLGVSQGEFSEDSALILNTLKSVLAGQLPAGINADSITKAILGALGLPDPTQIGTEGGTDNTQQNTDAGIEANPTTPEGSYVSYSRNALLTTAQAQSYARSTLSQAGQTLSANQLQQSQSYVSASQSGVTETTKQSQQAAQSASSAETTSSNAQDESDLAQKETESQAVLKHIAAIAAKQAQMQAGSSDQNSYLSNQLSVASGQLHALVGQQAVSNQILIALKNGQAYQMMEATNATRALSEINEAGRQERQANAQTVSDSVNLYNFQGLVPQLPLGGTQ